MIIEASFFGLICAVFWGASDYFLSKGSKNLYLHESNIFLKIPGIVLILPILLWKGISIDFDFHLIVIAGSTLFTTLAFLAYTKALSLGSTTVVTSIGSIYPLFTLIFTILVFGASVSFAQVSYIAIIILGVVLVSAQKSSQNKRMGHQSLIYVLISALAFGISFGMLGFIKNIYQWQEILFLIGIFMILYSLIIFAFKSKDFKRLLLINQRRYNTLLAGSMLTMGSMFYYIGFERTGAVIVLTILCSTSILFTTMMCYWLESDKLRSHQYVGMMLILTGVILLNI